MSTIMMEETGVPSNWQTLLNECLSCAPRHALSGIKLAH